MVHKMNARASKTDEEYIAAGKQAWEQSRQILLQTDNWSHHTGKDLHSGCVTSRKFERLGKVWRLEAILDTTPQELFDVLITGVNDWPLWNNTIEECKTLQVLNENTDIAYSVGAAQVGGLVSSRDFVNLRHWKPLDENVVIAAACHTTHKNMPPCKKHVRAENNPASYVFINIPGEPNKCHFYCFLNTDLKGWLPQFLIDQAMSGVLMEYLKHLQIYITGLQKQKPAGVLHLSALNIENTPEDQPDSESDSDDFRDVSESSDSDFYTAECEKFVPSPKKIVSSFDKVVPNSPMVEPVCS